MIYRSSEEAGGPWATTLDRFGRAPRRAAAAVELAILASLLAFLFVIAVDYARVFFYALGVQNAAYEGALYGSASSTNAADTEGIKQYVLKYTSDLSPAPTVTPTLGFDSNGNSTISVKVDYTFSTVVNYPGIPTTVPLSRTVTMRVLP